MATPYSKEAASSTAHKICDFDQTAPTPTLVEVFQRIAVALEKQNELIKKHNSTLEDIWLCM